MTTPTDTILKNFEKISSIPRGTKFEAGIRQWLMDWAAAHSFKSRKDAAGNLAIYVPASAGYESRAPLILQGHMDMVWQKVSNSEHDFTRDPIQLIRDGDWLHANGTTLGADNGIAIALMMSLVEDETVLHPPLELLLTVEEEFGLVGADNLDPGLVTGKTLINLDSDKEGVITIGCAGGGNVNITLPMEWESQSANDVVFEINVSGLQGGHSGEDIHKHRANANKLLARIMDAVQRDVPIRLSALKGGSARNAIPRNAEAVFTCHKEKAEQLRNKISALAASIQMEHSRTEPDLQVTLKEISTKLEKVASQADSEKALRLLVSLPNGVSAFSAETPGSVETSNTIGVMELKAGGFEINSNQRSSVMTRLEEITARVESLAWMAGAKTERTKLFPPWQPRVDSPLQKRSSLLYRSVFEKEAQIIVCHGGLECGIIGERCGGLDAISIGPSMEHLHSPDERLFVPSLLPVWDFLKHLLVEVE